jgi:hypothetical protein
MSQDNWNGDSWEETLRSMAREAGRSIERLIERVDVDEFADAMGVDADAARQWAESAGDWLRTHADSVGDEVVQRVSGAGRTAPGAGRTVPVEDPLISAAPHPLDLPTGEQGLALAALASGRWAVEPGTDALEARGGGPAPKDAHGVVREMRVRDWITADGEITAVGRHALSRWLDLATRR